MSIPHSCVRRHDETAARRPPRNRRHTMRKLIVAAFVSLDGVLQGPGGPQEDTSGGFTHGGWTVPFADPVFGASVDALFAQPFELVLGRRTYDIFAAHWPRV